tara:strand:+ start:445 stop:1452 length:1008 start_codon:yes stop_codon:yes gene_type:complete
MALNRRDRVTLEMYRQKAGNQQFQNFGNLVNKAIGEPSVGSIAKAGLSGAKGIAQRAMADARRLGTGTSLRDRSIAQTFLDEGRDPRISTPVVQAQTNLPSSRDTLERSKPLPQVDQIQEQPPGIPTPEKLTENRKKQLEEYISPEGSEEAWNDFYNDSKRQAEWEILTNQNEPRNQPVVTENLSFTDQVLKPQKNNPINTPQKPLVTSNTTDTQNPLVPTPNKPVKTTPVKPKVTKNTTALPKPKRKSSDKKIVPSKAEKAKTKALKETTDKTIKQVEEKTTKTTSSGTPLAKGFDDQILAGLLGVGIGVGTNQLLQPTPQPKDPNPQHDRYYR